MTSQPNVRIRPEIAAELDALAQATGRSPSEPAEEALVGYLDHQRWAVEHITEGLRQAEDGEFVSDKEMERIFNMYRDTAETAK